MSEYDDLTDELKNIAQALNNINTTLKSIDAILWRRVRWRKKE